MIDCSKARELAAGYIDGELSEAECLAYEEHISCCEHCHEEYDMLRNIVSDLPKTAESLPEGFADRMHVALVKSQQDTREKKFVFPYYRTASVIAAALVIAFVGKFGVYDVYKKSMDDSVSVGTETELEVGEGTEIDVVDETVPPVKPASEVKTPRAIANEDVIAVPVAQEHETEPVSEVAPEIIAAPEVAAVDDITVSVADTTVSVADVSEDNLTKSAAENTPAVMARMIPSGEGAAPVEDIVPETPSVSVADTDIAKTSDDTQSASDEVTDTPAPTALIPAIVNVHGGDGSMMLFKKFLLTFLSGEEITGSGNDITIAVSADEYDDVISYIRSNEYVKSVVDGAPFDGKAIIIIKCE